MSHYSRTSKYIKSKHYKKINPPTGSEPKKLLKIAIEKLKTELVIH